MPESLPAIECPSCGKRFVWQAGLAGQRVRCRCSQLMRMPDEPPKVVEAPPKPPPGGLLAAAMSSGKSAVTVALEAREDEVQVSRFREWVLPMLLLVSGVMVNYAAWGVLATKRGSSIWLGLIGATVNELIQLIVYVPIALGAIIVVAGLMDLSIGDLWSTLRKLAAVMIGPGAVADVLFFSVMTQIEFDLWVVAIGFTIYLILCGIPLGVLFEIGVHETAMIVVILVVPRFIALMVLGTIFVGLFFP